MRIFSKYFNFLLLLICFNSTESRAIPAAEQDEFGLEPHQRVCLYVNCPDYQTCVSVNGVPQCQTSPALTGLPPCEVHPCLGEGSVCDQFGTQYQSECALKSASCNSTAQLILTSCPQATDCSLAVRTLLASYTAPTEQEMQDRTNKANRGSLSYSDIKESVFPSCEVNGHYKQTQCYPHIPNYQFCWCVEPDTGVYKYGSFQSGRPDCTNYGSNCSLLLDTGDLVYILNGDTYTHSCSTHSCSNGVVTTRQDSNCLLCPPNLLSRAKRRMFSHKGPNYSRETNRDPNLNKRRTLKWYFDRCDRNNGGEMTRREFRNCHRNIPENLVSEVCMNAVFEDCSGSRSDSILPSQWERCFLRSKP